jgi:hypothetical protein
MAWSNVRGVAPAGTGESFGVTEKDSFLAARCYARDFNWMDFSHFLRIERDGQGRAKHYVVHMVDPKLSLELVPDGGAPDKVGRGVIKRVCVPNSWAGDYTRSAKLIGVAQEFFARSFAAPVPQAETRRFAR